MLLFFTFKMKRMKLINNIKNWIGKIRFTYYEYLYFFSLDSSLEENSKNEKLLKDIFKFIESKNKIEFSDFLINYADAKTYYIATTCKKNVFLQPLFYEVYAYSKLKNLSKFTYSYEKTIFNNTQILKFKIKCFGKK